MRILVIEDDKDTLDYLLKGLTESGHTVDRAGDGKDGLFLALESDYDVLVVDRMLPALEGLSLIQTLRSSGKTAPVLILSALGDVDDRVAGLHAGGDDYLVKPFAFGELIARVRSLLRREASRTSSVLRVGELELDDVKHRASHGDRDLELTAKEFALLRYFMAHPDEVLSQEHLLEHVWDEHADPFTNTVRVTVGTLRRKLSGSSEETLIETVIGSGYRLLAPTEQPHG